jgi:hypothetical protein
VLVVVLQQLAWLLLLLLLSWPPPAAALQACHLEAYCCLAQLLVLLQPCLAHVHIQG